LLKRNYLYAVSKKYDDSIIT